MENEFEVSLEELEGQPAAVSEEGTSGSEGATDQDFSTLLSSLKDELLQELNSREKEILRKIQSGDDRIESRVIGRLQDEFRELDRSVAKMKEAGIQVDDDQISALKQRRMLREIGGEPVTEEGQLAGPALEEPQGPPSPPDAAANPVLAEAAQMMADAGVKIERDDPEAKLIDLQTTSIKKFLDSIDAAIKAKLKRVQPSASEGEEPEENVTDTESKRANAAVRNPGTGFRKGSPASGSPSGLEGYDYLKRHYSNKK